MGDVKRNHPTSLRKGGKDLTQTGEKTRKAWEKLKSESDGMGDIFGDDMVGGLIGGAYTAVYQLADESFTSAADDYEAFGEGLTAAGDNHEQTEKLNVELVKKLSDILDGMQGGKA